ncbi:phage terminase large subunit [Melghirimyces algeriensis]|uniref:phage terminase large subunit n=1 Tax=Melghirimyces algeriensis TaxID=910412 RepID=UPI001FE4F84F|nr:phage terminase large subunit [Melghirimyces algeriensis]
MERIAWVNGRWINREDRQEMIDASKKLIKTYTDNINELSSDDLEELEREINELERLERIHRAEVDMLYFFYEYFSDARNPGNPDNLVPTPDVDMDDAPPFHQKLSRILDSVSNRNKTARIAWAASRGHAKSAYLSNAFPVREIVYRKRKMILIISETNAGSIKFLKWASSQLKFNLKLREDFGELLYEQKSRNEKDSETAFLTTSGIKMEATSLGTQIRGFRNGSQRPDLIILDDLESRDSNNTPELRQKAKDWLNSDLMPAYDPTCTAVIFMGTIVHPDSLLNYVLNERRDFIKNKFPAILSHPERTDLWSEFERIYKEYEPTQEEYDAMEYADEETRTPNEEAALRFYRENKEEMDRGVKVLWPQRFPMYELILEKQNYGTKAFNSEFMNNPIDEESRIFKPENFYYWDDRDPGFTVPAKGYDVFMGVDFAMGKQRGDYSAIVTIARDSKTKRNLVVDAWGDRVHPDTFIKIIVDKVLKYQPTRIAAEAQAAQEFFTFKLKEALRAKGYPSGTRVKEVKHRTRKELRIEALLPEIESGRLQFCRKHSLLLWQFEAYPQDHDDLPDALAMAWDIAKKGAREVVTKPIWL